MPAAALAPSAEVGALGDAHPFVVSNTFIDVLEPSALEDGGRPRSWTDSALYEGLKKIEKKSDLDSTEGALSESDTKTLDGLEGDDDLTCYSTLVNTAARACALAPPAAADGATDAWAFGKAGASPWRTHDDLSFPSATAEQDGAWTPEASVAAASGAATPRSQGTSARSDGGATPLLRTGKPGEHRERWGSGELAEDDQQRTTVMLRNLPNNYTRAMLLALLDKEGFSGLYDFLYMPIDFRSRASLGYSFVNLVDPAVALRFWKAFDGYSNWTIPSNKSCYVSWSGPHQGLQANIERWRNSPVMHGSVADECKPVIFRAGVRVGFPGPTKSTRAPRLRAEKNSCTATGPSPKSAKSWRRPGAAGRDSAGPRNSEVASCDEAAQSPTLSQSASTLGEEDAKEWLVSENVRLQMENQLLRQQQYACQGSWAVEDPTMYAQAQDGSMWVMQWPMSVVAIPVCMPLAPESVEAPICSSRSAREEAAPQPAHQKKQLQEKRDRDAAAGGPAAGVPRPSAAKAKGVLPLRWSEEDEDVAAEPELERTTVMLRNLPNNYCRAQLLRTLDSEGFAGKYDFVYLPIDLKSQACLGYAFVNMVDPSMVEPFWNVFDGYSKWAVPSKKVAQVSWSGPHQGLAAHVERYRNSPIMHSSVADKCKPVLFKDGVRVAFPEPTKATGAPRLRNAAPKSARRQPSPRKGAGEAAPRTTAHRV